MKSALKQSPCTGQLHACFNRSFTSGEVCAPAFRQCRGRQWDGGAIWMRTTVNPMP